MPRKGYRKKGRKRRVQKKNLTSRYSYCGINMRSSWEVNVAKIMRFEKIRFMYEPKRFFFKDGTNYLPDFYLPDYGVWIEVKGMLKTRDIYRMKNFARLGSTLYLLRSQTYYQIIKGKMSIKQFLKNKMFVITK